MPNEVFVQTMVFEPYITLKEISRAMGCSKSTIYRWFKLGMPVHYERNKRYYVLTEVREWFRNHYFRNKWVRPRNPRQTIGLEVKSW